MTANEAIKILEVAKAECEWNAPLDYQEAFDLAISTLREPNLQPTCNNLATDAISRQAAIDAAWFLHPDDRDALRDTLKELPSAQPEPLTDKEQRIFLAAMAREEKVCKEVDAEMTREPYEDSLVRICHEITRKVKDALWTI